jgi:hypothetical protein
VYGSVNVWPKSTCSGRVLIASEMESKMTGKAQARNDVGALLPSGSSFPFPCIRPSTVSSCQSRRLVYRPRRRLSACSSLPTPLTIHLGLVSCFTLCRVCRVSLRGSPSPSRSLAYYTPNRQQLLAHACRIQDSQMRLHGADMLFMLLIPRLVADVKRVGVRRWFQTLT